MGVNLWKSPEQNKIFAYVTGRIGEEGLIGLIPTTYLNSISSSVGDGHCVARIISLTDSACDIEVCLDSCNITEENINQQYNLLINKISVKYKPKKTFKTDIELPKNHNIKIGQVLSVKSKRPEDFIDYIYYKGFNHPVVIVDFVDQYNNVVARKSLGRERYNIIKANINGYNPQLTILHIDNPDKYTLKYIESIKSIASVEFSSSASLPSS